MLSEYKNGVCGYFANLTALTQYIAEKSPIDNKFSVLDAATAGEYDLTPENISYIINQTREVCGENYAASIYIDVDIVLNIVTTQYLISTVDVKE